MACRPFFLMTMKQRRSVATSATRLGSGSAGDGIARKSFSPSSTAVPALTRACLPFSPRLADRRDGVAMVAASRQEV